MHERLPTQGRGGQGWRSASCSPFFWLGAHMQWWPTVATVATVAMVACTRPLHSSTRARTYCWSGISKAPSAAWAVSHPCIRATSSQPGQPAATCTPAMTAKQHRETAQSLSRAGRVPAPDVVSIFHWIGDQGGVYQGSRLLVGLATGGLYFCPTAAHFCFFLLYPRLIQGQEIN